MGDPKVFWLVLTNILLGAAVVLLVIGLITGALCDLVLAWRRRRAAARNLDEEVRALWHTASDKRVGRR